MTNARIFGFLLAQVKVIQLFGKHKQRKQNLTVMKENEGKSFISILEKGITE